MQFGKQLFTTTAILIAIVGQAYASDNSGWTNIIRLDAWQASNNAYLEADHNCWHADSRRYSFPKDKPQFFDLLRTAFENRLQVNLSYAWDGSSGLARVGGVRVKRPSTNSTPEWVELDYWAYGDMFTQNGWATDYNVPEGKVFVITEIVMRSENCNCTSAPFTVRSGNGNSGSFEITLYRSQHDATSFGRTFQDGVRVTAGWWFDVIAPTFQGGSVRGYLEPART